jgi:3'-phosphoadenosine 5'-phosphosulfate sulfotransferase (PAPS reductase)/FAD synthetase
MGVKCTDFRVDGWDQKFIRHLEIPYCPLYDQGYTSLGGTTDTRPNPALLVSDKEDPHFRPAYELVEDEEERLGRDRATPMGTQTPRDSQVISLDWMVP